MALPFLVRAILRNTKSLTGKNTTDAALNLFEKGYKVVFKGGIPPTSKDYVGLSTAFRNAVNRSETKGIIKKQTVREAAQVTAEGKSAKHRLHPELAEAQSKKQSKSRKKNIAEGKGMNLPHQKSSTRKLSGSTRKWVPQLDAYINPYTQNRGIHEVMEQALRRDKQRGLLDIAFGKGTKDQKKKRQVQFLKQFQKNISDDEFMEDYLKAATPYGTKAGRYFKEDFSKLSTDEQYKEVVKNYLKSRGHSDKEITDLFPTRFATTGHIPPVRESYADWLGFGNKASLEAFEQSANPRMWNPEFGLVNIAKGTSDPWIFKAAQKNKLSPEGLEQARHMYDAFGIKSLIRGKPIGTHNLERQANLIDWATTGTPYQTKLFTGRPGTTDKDKAKRMFKRMLERGDITYEEIFAAIHKGKYPGYNKGGVVNGYAAGGIGKLGVNILKKLAKKMPEEDFLRVMETLWKGVDPKRSGRYKAWAKNRWSPGYKWPYQKSRIKGPDIKKSHMADLSPGESVELQSKYADDIWEYKMKKKLGRDLYEDLEYPFLNPENDAFISTAPRTGLGRYQMRHFVDPENVGPVDKYQVYDWWDDILNRMRKKPKFKYVKDAKGKIVLKEVK